MKWSSSSFFSFPSHTRQRTSISLRHEHLIRSSWKCVSFVPIIWFSNLLEPDLNLLPNRIDSYIGYTLSYAETEVDMERRNEPLNYAFLLEWTLGF